MSDELAPVLIVGLMVLIPIIWMLLGHQKEMAKIIHAGAMDNERIQALEAQVAELRDRVNQQALELDRARTAPSGPVDEAISQRIGSVS